MEERRIADYFIVAGLADDTSTAAQLDPVQKPEYVKNPIVDVVVINRSQGETPPEGFECLELTPTGFPANLNHGSLVAAEMFICLKREKNIPPLVDLGVMYHGREQLKSGCDVVMHTPYGRSANVNNTGGEKIYLTYSRAEDMIDSDTLAVVDICVILPSKGECAPHAFCQINKNLNQGMIGSEVNLCYKKSMIKNNFITYKAAILSRFPQHDYPGFRLPEQVAMFCLPLGATIECWSTSSRHPLPVFSTFVLTGETGEKCYGAAVVFYKDHETSRLTPSQKSDLGLTDESLQASKVTVQENQSICLLSRWPFFDSFKKFLFYLFRISVSGPQIVPLERHIAHFMTEIPFPSSHRPRILIQLSMEEITLTQPEETPLPKSGSCFTKFLINLGPENCIAILLYVLMEHRIVIHSLRPDLLTSVAETVTTMIFPFHWQCPYIPLCPLALSGVLDSPTPFIVGIDSRYFDMYDPPQDITFVDLDAQTITVSEERKSHSVKLFPKKALKTLRATLDQLYETLVDDPSYPNSPGELEVQGSFSVREFSNKRKQRMLDMSVQEAFLQFMASVLRGYNEYLLPVTISSATSGIDIASLFNIDGFLKSHDKSYQKFLTMLTKTQCFCRFIEERSFGSDVDVGFSFFDDCLKKLDSKRGSTLIDFDDKTQSERTVFISPPQPTGLPSDVLYDYSGFSNLKKELFLDYSKEMPGKKGSLSKMNEGILRRSKQDIKSAMKAIFVYHEHPEQWAKCLVWISYSLWFISLPSYLQFAPSKRTALETAYSILVKMHDLNLPPLDEVCYRIVLHLCGAYNEPTLAIKIFGEMKQRNICPNATTYGFYNKVLTTLQDAVQDALDVFFKDETSVELAVLDGKWVLSDSRNIHWKRLRNVVFAVARFRRGLVPSRNSSAMFNPSGGSEDGSKESLNRQEIFLQQLGSLRQAAGDWQSVSAFNNSDKPDNSGEQRISSSQENQPECCPGEDKVDDGEPSRGPQCSTDPVLSRPSSTLIPVTAGDPLGWFEKKTDGRKNSTESEKGTASRPAPNLKSEKSRSCDELDASAWSKVHPIELRVTCDDGSHDMKSADQTRVKTLPRAKKVLFDEMEAPLVRSHSFGNFIHSAVSQLNSTYLNFRNSLKPTSSENISGSKQGIGNGKIPRLVIPMQTEHRAASADDLLEKKKNSVRQRNYLGDYLDQYIPVGSDNSAASSCDDLSFSSSMIVEDDVIVRNDVAVEVDLCSQSKCPNCSNLLFDEEIMAHWSANDSELKTRCLCCEGNFVPTLQVVIKDFRVFPDAPRRISQSQIDQSSNIVDSGINLDCIGKESSSDAKPDGMDGSYLGKVSRSSLASDQMNVEKNFDDAIAMSDLEGSPKVLPHAKKSLSVPYLNPIVLRKELENLFEQHGEDCLNNAELPDQHPIIFWNLVWFYRRLDLPSHLDNLILKSANHSRTAFDRNQSIVVRALWDSDHTHEEFGQPMYTQWNANVSDVLDCEEVPGIQFSRRVLQQIISGIVRHNIPICMVLGERNKNRKRKTRVLYRSIYHDILFLAISVLGKQKFNIDDFDKDYERAFDNLSYRDQRRMMAADAPSKEPVIWCRRLFGHLELLKIDGSSVCN